MARVEVVRQLWKVGILLYSADMHSHVQHLGKVFEPLRLHQLFLKQSKCVFRASEVEYLGHKISAEGVQMD